MNSLISTLKVNKKNLIKSFNSQVFATDRSLVINVADGKSFTRRLLLKKIILMI